jgi:acetyltransferase-like isoleucine patch superfamily enzyme
MALAARSVTTPSLLEDLRRLYREQEAAVRAEWNRSLPFGELVADRWARARALGFGPESSIYDSATVLGSVRVGTNTWIGPQVMLDGSGGLEVGSFCSISAGVQIYTHDTVAWAVTGGRSGPARSAVRIGDRCYIGPLTVIARGVTIGDGCVIGAHSFVDRDLPDGSLAWGAPCRVRGRVIVSADGDVRFERTESDS